MTTTYPSGKFSKRREGGREGIPTLSVHDVPRGESSVIPQACNTSTPCPSTKERSMEGGQAAPPTTVRLIVLNPLLSC